MQRQLSSFDIYTIAYELQGIVGYQVEKIYQLSRDEILIRIKNIHTKEKKNLFVRNSKFICLTNKEPEKPSRPSTFAMALRKYLSNGRITSITQHEFDRIIKLKIGKKEGEYTLVFEFFSNGNIILVDPDRKIIIPLLRQTWRDRKVKGREPYIPPPPQINPFNLTLERFTDLLKESDADLVRTLAVNINLSGFVAEEICIRANVDKNIKIQNLDDETIKKVYASLSKFLDLFKNKKFEPLFVKKDDEIIDILPFRFKSYKDVSFEKTTSMVEGLSSFIDIREVETKKEETSSDKIIGKLERQLVQQEENIKKLKQQIELKKLEGDLIYLNYQIIENLLKDIKKILELKEKEEEIKKINEQDIVKVFDPVKNLLIVNLKDSSGKNFEMKLNFRKSTSENAQKAYDDLKKFKNKLRGAEKAAVKTKTELKHITKKKKLEGKKQEKLDKKIEKKEKKFWFERFRWFISSEGNIVIGGRDAKSNELVVKKYLKEGDRYAHADVQGAPSIVVKSRNIHDEKIDISKKTLEEACIFAASFSKAWKQFAEAQAYWVLPEQVSKTAQSGEFVPHGAFIIRGKRNYCRCKLEVAVGKIMIDDVSKVMCGPTSAVKKHTDQYVVLVPGDTKKSDVARILSKVFDVNVDSLDRVLPPGGITIIDAVGVKL